MGLGDANYHERHEKGQRPMTNSTSMFLLVLLSKIPGGLIDEIAVASSEMSTVD